MARRARRAAPFTLFAFQDIITSVTGILLLLTLLLTLELIVRKPTSAAVSIAVAREIQQAIATARTEIEQLRSQTEAANQHSAELAKASPALVARQVFDLQQQVDRLNVDLANARQALETTTKELERSLATQFDRQGEREELDQLQKQLQELQDKLDSLRSSNRLIFNQAKGESKSPWLAELSASGVRAAPLGVAQTPLVLEARSAKEVLQAFESLLAMRDASREYIVAFVKPSAVHVYRELESIARRHGFDLGVDLIGEEQTVLDPEKGAGL